MTRACPSHSRILGHLSDRVHWPLLRLSRDTCVNESLGCTQVLGHCLSHTRACCARMTRVVSWHFLPGNIRVPLGLRQRLAWVPFLGIILGHYRVIESKYCQMTQECPDNCSGRVPNSGSLSGLDTSLAGLCVSDIPEVTPKPCSVGSRTRDPRLGLTRDTCPCWALVSGMP